MYVTDLGSARSTSYSFSLFFRMAPYACTLNKQGYVERLARSVLHCTPRTLVIHEKSRKPMACCASENSNRKLNVYVCMGINACVVLSVLVYF